jgi:hypothetical protein
MPSSDQPTRRGFARRAYVLLTIVILTVLILLGASVLLLVAKEASVAGVKEKKNTEAYGIALAGLQWSMGNLSSQNAKETISFLVANQTTAGVVISGKRVFPFNQNGRFAGVPTSPPTVGTSNDTWTSIGKGHYAILADYDPLDPARSMVMRAIGIVSDGEVVLESSVTLNPSQGVPSAFVGCFNSATRVDWNDSVGPYDYIGNYRFDGGPGFPIAVSKDAPQINGFVKASTSSRTTVSVKLPSGYPTSRQWKGTESLRVEPLAVAVPGIRTADVENRFGGLNRTSLLTDYKGPFGTTDTAGPPDGYTANPYLANDPRIVDVLNSTFGGLGLNVTKTDFQFGGLWDGNTYKNSIDSSKTEFQSPKGYPIIAYLAAPPALATAMTTATGGTPSTNEKKTLQPLPGLLGQSEWEGSDDNKADMGFYACRTTASTDLTEAVEECVKGTTGTSAPNWSASTGPVNTSGRAWSIVTDIVRQCTGSGRAVNRKTGKPWYDKDDNPNGIKCAHGFEWLENVAACTILPPNIMKAVDLNDAKTNDVAYNGNKPSGDGSVLNDFTGCHPGCLIAADISGDGSIDQQDHPFRSVCLNLDPTTSTTYGPGAIEDADMVKLDSGFPPSSPNWTAATDRVGSLMKVYAAMPGSGGPSNWYTFNRVTTPTVSGAGVFKTIDPTTGSAITPGIKGGFIRELGNPAFISRLDLSDRGPLGTCEQNCLAYGYGQDVTYGVHRTPVTGEPNPVTVQPAGIAATDTDRTCIAQVPLHTDEKTMKFGPELCNLDYNLDGLLDRKSYALFSSYREECASPNVGVPYAPAVDISSDNDSLLGDGCMNRLPNHLSSVPPTYLTNFCDGENDATFTQAVSDLSAVARTITPRQLLNQNKGALANNDGWFGGAKCHVGTAYTINGLTHTHTGNVSSLPVTDLDRLQHQDFWIEDSCPNPVIVRVTANTQMSASQTCGCGILIIENGGLTMGRDSFFMWRGLVIWNLKDRVSRTISLVRSRGTTLYVDGALVVTGGAALSVNINKDGESTISTKADPSDPQTAKVLFRMNRQALDEAFRAVQQPVRTIRRLR